MCKIDFLRPFFGIYIPYCLIKFHFLKKGSKFRLVENKVKQNEKKLILLHL
jgi:hypothetical protein